MTRPAFTRLLTIVLAAALLGGGCATTATHDAADVERTWDKALVALPFSSPTSWDRLLAAAPPNHRHPTVVYLHGCTGLSSVARRDMTLLARAGYAVIAPDSFARRYRPSNCEAEGTTGGTFPMAFALRHGEIRHAAARLRTVPWVDPAKVVLMGFSEGGIAVAAYDGDEFAAHVITGWTCHAPSDAPQITTGVWAPHGKPVLAIVASADPWFVWPGWRGHCGESVTKARVESIVVDATEHHVTWHPAASRALLAFLARQTSASR